VLEDGRFGTLRAGERVGEDLRTSAVGFAAVLDGQDEDGIAKIAEADAIVASPETKFRRLDVLEALDIAFAGREKAS